MKVSTYIRSSGCEKTDSFCSVIEPESERQLFLAGFFRNMSKLIFDICQSDDGYCSEKNCSLLSEKLTALFEETLTAYEVSWFGQDWQRQNRINLDRSLFLSFKDWLLNTIVNANIRHFNVPTNMVLSDNGSDVLLEDTVHLLLEKDNRYFAFLFHFSKAPCGLKGHTPATRIDYNLSLLVSKYGLENEYPKVQIVPVFIASNENGGKAEPWSVNDTAKSNVFYIDFSDLYDENGQFDYEICHSHAIVAAHACRKNCTLCSYAHYCKMQKAAEKRLQHTVKGKGPYQMPVFDEEQRQVVNHTSGTMLCCAGPGSGKTASLVGRVHNLVSSGKVYPEFLLLISFTEKAAAELSERISSFLEEDEMPRICTLNALGSEIIRSYESITNTPPHKLLKTAGEHGIVKNLLLSLDAPLTGVNYKQYSGNQYSTVNTVTRYLHQIEEGLESELFIKHPELNESEFRSLYRMYKSVLLSENYITFDDQIRLAVQYMKNPAVADMVTTHYQYVMVDEFQDINEEQKNLILAIAGKNNNLVCIGDDDQSIYAWRGGSSKYMENFRSLFPDASIVKLQNNYRSTHNIVGICNEILKDTQNGRIEKHVVAANQNIGSKIPLIGGNSFKDVSEAINNALERGFHYRDIAIIATKNSDLETLHENLPQPTTLASTYVINDFLFNVVYYLLGITLNLFPGFNPYAALGLLFEMPSEWFAQAKQSLNGQKPLNDKVFSLISYARSISHTDSTRFIARIAAYLDMDESVSEKTMLSLAEQSNISSLQELYLICSDMVEFKDDSKLEYPPDDNILLITAHSSKGKEFPVVIVWDTNAYQGHIALNDNDNSVDRRLLYVSVSRAQNMLYLLKEAGTKSLLDESAFVTKYKINKGAA